MSSIFREKSLDKLNSPEKLDDYVKVSNPGRWMIFAAVVLLFAGIGVWGLYGNIETYEYAAVIVENGTATAYVKAGDIGSIAPGMSVNIGGIRDNGTVSEVKKNPVEITGNFDAYAMETGGMKEGDWYYPVRLKTDAADGTYESQIVTEKISPVSFLLN